MIDWAELIARFVAWQEGRRRSRATYAKQRYLVTLFAAFAGVRASEVEPATIAAWLAESPSEVQALKRAATLRVFFGWAKAEGQVKNDPTLLAAPNRREARREPTGSRWQVAMGGWMEWKLAAGHASTSLRTQCWHFTYFADAMESRGRGPYEVAYDDLIKHMASVAEWAPDARKGHRSVIRTFYKWATLTDRIAKDPAYMLPTVKVPIGEPNPVPDEIVAQVLADVAGFPQLRAMVLLAACCGLRRAEIATLRTANIQGAELRVTGKGGKTRIIPMPPIVINALIDLDPKPGGWVFPGETRAGHVGVDWVGGAVSDAFPEPWTAHKLRHRFATATHEVEGDLLTVQRLLGHASPVTTIRYTRIRHQSDRRAVDGAAAMFS